MGCEQLEKFTMSEPNVSLLKLFSVSVGKINLFFLPRYEVMHKCWQENSDERPSFLELIGRIDEMIQNSSSS